MTTIAMLPAPRPAVDRPERGTASGSSSGPDFASTLDAADRAGRAEGVDGGSHGERPGTAQDAAPADGPVTLAQVLRASAALLGSRGAGAAVEGGPSSTTQTGAAGDGRVAADGAGDATGPATAAAATTATDVDPTAQVRAAGAVGTGATTPGTAATDAAASVTTAGAAAASTLTPGTTTASTAPGSTGTDGAAPGAATSAQAVDGARAVQAAATTTGATGTATTATTGTTGASGVAATADAVETTATPGGPGTASTPGTAAQAVPAGTGAGAGAEATATAQTGLVGSAGATAPQPAPSAEPGPLPPSGTPAGAEPKALAEQLGAKLSGLRSAPAGEHVLTLRVDPESMGPVRVVARIGAEGVRIELLGVTDQAREALKAALPDLRRDLVAAGLTGELNLGNPSTGRGSGADAGTGRDDDGAPVPAGSPTGAPGAGAEAPETTDHRPLDRPLGRLDLLV